MNGYDTSDEQQPVTWFRGHPIFAAYFVAIIFMVSILVTTFINAFGAHAWLDKAVFDSRAVWRGEVWRILTYGLVNPPEGGLFLLLTVFMVAWFGRELEKFFGRRVFLQFFSLLYLLTPALLTVVGLWRPSRTFGMTGSLALFVAFATLYPNALMLFNLLAKWVAAVFVVLYSLIALSQRDEITLISLWATTGFAFAFVRFHQGHIALPTVPFPRRKPALRVLPDLPEKKNTEPAAKAPKQATMEEVDALLDKIAQSGIHSLTAKERAKLDAARANILKRGGQK